MLDFGESRHPVFRATRVHCPEVSSKAKAVKNCRFTLYLKLFVAQLFLGTVQSFRSSRKISEEYETFHDMTGQPVVGGQSSSSFVPSVIKIEVPSNCDDRVRKDLLLQQNGERIEKLSRQTEKIVHGFRIPECC